MPGLVVSALGAVFLLRILGAGPGSTRGGLQNGELSPAAGRSLRHPWLRSLGENDFRRPDSNRFQRPPKETVPHFAISRVRQHNQITTPNAIRMAHKPTDGVFYVHFQKRAVTHEQRKNNRWTVERSPAEIRRTPPAGYDIMDLERFAPDTRHLIVLGVFSHEYPVGFKGECLRLFLTDGHLFYDYREQSLYCEQPGKELIRNGFCNLRAAGIMHADTCIFGHTRSLPESESRCSPLTSSELHLITAKLPWDSSSTLLIHSISWLAFARKS